MEILYTLLCSRQATFINMVIGALLFLALVFLLLRRSSRDERGWKIIGKASIAALLCFAVCATLFSHAMQYVTIQRSPPACLWFWTLILPSMQFNSPSTPPPRLKLRES